jgi:ADP-ribose pyrophosphatase YjhB (NUDIX family)
MNNLSTNGNTNNFDNYCNNCGKYGHLFHQCKLPITSIGIIAYKKINDIIYYLLIRRKHSLGFIDFMRGKYPLYDKNYLINIINEMSLEEKELLLTKDFDYLWEYIWGKNANMQYRVEEKTSKNKFNSLQLGINLNNLEYNLKSLIEDSVTCWNETEWGFPKGRRNYLEKDLQCALREFEEETGYNKNELNIILNIQPYEEIFTGSNYKSYKHRYYIAQMKPNIENENENKNENVNENGNYEVSKMGWYTYEESCSLIRPYNLEKLSILEKVNNILTNYKIL